MDTLENNTIKTVSFDISAVQKFVEYLKKHNIKQISVCNDLKMSRPTVSNYLSGRFPISNSFRSKLNNYLGTSF